MAEPTVTLGYALYAALEGPGWVLVRHARGGQGEEWVEAVGRFPTREAAEALTLYPGRLAERATESHPST
jgi:hypothetical protein